MPPHEKQDAETMKLPAHVPDKPLPDYETAIIGKLMIEAHGLSDPGCVRTNNEDCFLVAPLAGLYLVADGMGGAQAGEHASRMATDTMKELVSAAAGNVTPSTLVQAIEEANRRVKAAASADSTLQGMGTTMVAAVERGGELLVASVGDSRLYRYREGELTSVTEDQTWVNEVGRKLGLDEATLKSHPMRHVLTMAVGVSENLRINSYSIAPLPGETLLMCSDGLHGVVGDEEISASLAQAGSLQETAKRLIELARDHGGPDNVTVIVMHVVAPPAAA